MISREIIGRVRFFIIFITSVFVVSSCSSTKEATVPTAWSGSVGWANSAEVTSTDHLVVQNQTDIVIRNGESGQVILEEIVEKDGGLFSGLTGPDVDNEVSIRYWHQTFPASGTMLLFDRSTDDETVRSIDLQTGEELWRSESLPWNIEKYQDEGEAVTKFLFRQSTGAGVGAGLSAEVMLQNRAVESLVEEIPQKNAFLFKTINGMLQLIDARNGNILWQTEGFNSTGMASVEYLEDIDEILIAGDKAGLKDLITSAVKGENPKHIYRINAENGNIIWSSEYKGRNDQIDNITLQDDNALLYFTGGSLEFFNYEDGTRKFGTRDEMGMEEAKVASAVSDQNTMETVFTSMPIIEGDMVYAINPTGEINTFSLDDKQLVKYNYETGEEIWKSPVLEKAIDVRDMSVTDDLVIVRIPGAGNMVGGTKDPGVYAFDKETGEAAWQFTEPFSKKYTSKVLYSSSDIITGDGNSVYRVNLADGEIVTQQVFEDPDIGDISDIAHLPVDTALAVIGSKGVAVVHSDDLSPAYNGIVDGRLGVHQLNEGLFTAVAGKTLSKKVNFYAFDLGNQQTITSFTLGNTGGQSPYGNLGSQGYVVIDQGEQVLTFDNDTYSITSYEL